MPTSDSNNIDKNNVELYKHCPSRGGSKDCFFHFQFLVVFHADLQLFSSFCFAYLFFFAFFAGFRAAKEQRRVCI